MTFQTLAEDTIMIVKTYDGLAAPRARRCWATAAP